MIKDKTTIQVTQDGETVSRGESPKNVAGSQGSQLSGDAGNNPGAVASARHEDAHSRAADGLEVGETSIRGEDWPGSNITDPGERDPREPNSAVISRSQTDTCSECGCPNAWKDAPACHAPAATQERRCDVCRTTWVNGSRTCPFNCVGGPEYVSRNIEQEHHISDYCRKHIRIREVPILKYDCEECAATTQDEVQLTDNKKEK